MRHNTLLITLLIALLMYCIIPFLVFQCTDSNAQELEVGYNFYTNHIGRESPVPVNEDNNGIYLNINDWEAIIFKTSRWKDGLYLGNRFWKWKYEPFNNGIYGQLNLHGGIVRDYSHAHMPSFKGFIPVVGPTFEFGHELNDYAIAVDTFSYIKPWDGKGLTTWVLKIKIPLNSF